MAVRLSTRNEDYPSSPLYKGVPTFHTMNLASVDSLTWKGILSCWRLTLIFDVKISHMIKIDEYQASILTYFGAENGRWMSSSGVATNQQGDIFYVTVNIVSLIDACCVQVLGITILRGRSRMNLPTRGKSNAPKQGEKWSGSRFAWKVVCS